MVGLDVSLSWSSVLSIFGYSFMWNLWSLAGVLVYGRFNVFTMSKFRLFSFQVFNHGCTCLNVYYCVNLSRERTVWDCTWVVPNFTFNSLSFYPRLNTDFQLVFSFVWIPKLFIFWPNVCALENVKCKVGGTDLRLFISFSSM